MKLFFFKAKQTIFIWIVLLASISNQISAQSNVSNCTPIPEVRFPGGRVIMSFDGNVHDDDDIIAMPFAAALWWAAGLKDNVVQIEYNNHVCNFNGTENDNYGPGAGDDSQNMRISAQGAISRFGYDADVFFDFEKQATASTNRMAKEIEKSTATNPLWILAGGPMETIYRGMNKAIKGHEHVVIISHGIFNQNHDHCNGKTWSNLKAKFGGNNKTFFVEHCKGSCNSTNELPTQNGGFNSRRGFDWMKNNANPDLDWLYRRNPFPNKIDPSDAGMAYYLITGGPFNNGNKRGNPKDARKLLENPCLGSSNNNSNKIITTTDRQASHDFEAVAIKASPNPARETITVSGLKSGEPIRIYNLLGKMIMNHISKNQKELIDVSGLKSGLYVISIAGKNNIKFIKE